MTFPHYIQKAVDLGLLEASGDKITGCKKEEVETIMGMARIIEKIQPTTTAKEDDTTDQEAIVLCRVLSSPSGLARELWADLNRLWYRPRPRLSSPLQEMRLLGLAAEQCL